MVQYLLLDIPQYEKRRLTKVQGVLCYVLSRALSGRLLHIESMLTKVLRMRPGSCIDALMCGGSQISPQKDVEGPRGSGALLGGSLGMEEILD